MEAPNGLEIVRTTWNQFEIVLAEKVSYASKPTNRHQVLFTY